MTYDPPTGWFWIGDVGQDSWEEVDVLEQKAANFQWAYMEGFHPTPDRVRPAPKNFIGFEAPPVYEYRHGQQGNCVIGGYVYRGTQFAKELGGKYIFGDNGSGRIWAMTLMGKKPPIVEYLCNMPPGINYSGLSSFGEDANHELYMLKMGRPSKIYKLVRADRDERPMTINFRVPPQLSKLRAFTDLTNLTVAPGIIPYDINAPFWSDNAIKSRWIAVPRNEKIKFAAMNNFTFPAGTVFIKNFDLTTNEITGEKKRLETRFIVREAGGGVYGVTYKWRDNKSDADLVPSPATEDILITGAEGVRTQTWYYPGPLDCLICHNPNAGSVLGVKARQLNGPFTYPNGVTDNQIRTWNHLGLFTPALAETNISGLPSLARITDTNATLDHRVRSYLDSNCSQCHGTSGVGGYFDARFNVPLAHQHIISGPLANSMDDPATRVVAPGNPSKSMLLTRIGVVGNLQMPPLARNLVDTNAVNVVTEWIKTLPPEEIRAR
jgi:uncharacterized repeat protein (TIGR03806 family)